MHLSATSHILYNFSDFISMLNVLIFIDKSEIVQYKDEWENLC